MADIWIPSSVDLDSRLVKRFTLSHQSSVPNPYWLQRTISPVTNIDVLLRDYLASTLVIVPTATGWYTAKTVPSGKKWFVHVLRVYRSTGAAEQFSNFEVYDLSATKSVGLGAFTATNDHTLLFNTPLPMNEGDYFRVYVSTHNAGDELTAQVWVEEEDSF